MASCEQHTSLAALHLPIEFEDLEGLLQTDIQAIVTMVTQRASERLLLTRREYKELKHTLWNGITEVVNTALEPLTAECR